MVKCGLILRMTAFMLDRNAVEALEAEQTRNFGLVGHMTLVATMLESTTQMLTVVSCHR